MRIFAMALNVLLLLFVSYFIAKEGFPNEAKNVVFVLLVVIAPVVSILALRVDTGDSWLSLFFRRKALEERMKIETLNTKK